MFSLNNIWEENERMHLKSGFEQGEFGQGNPDYLHKKILYPQIIQNNYNPDDLAEHLLHYGGEILQQIEDAQHIGIINCSLLALVYLKKGEWDKALTIGENAYHDALSQGGVVLPICEMILGMILLERGNAKEAGERLKNSAVLLLKMAKQITPGSSDLRKVQPINLEKDPYLFRFQMFGPFRVFYHHEEIPANSWRTVKSRDLLAYLAHRGKPVSTDQILEDLWPELSIDKASAVFHTTLYYLRRLIQQYTNEEIILHGSRRYQLRPGSVMIDRYQFEEITERALGKTITETMANELEIAAALYRGDYLEELDYPWMIPVQEQLKNTNINLKQELAGYYMKNRMYSRALVHIKQIMAEDPYSEEALRLLMTALAGKGDLLAVRKAYMDFAKILYEDLGTRPSFEIIAFYKELCSVKTVVMHA